MANLTQGSFGYVPQRQETAPQKESGNLVNRIKEFIIEDKFLLIGIGIFGLLVVWGLITFLTSGGQSKQEAPVSFSIPSYSSSSSQSTQFDTTISTPAPLVKPSATPTPSASPSPSPSVSPSQSPSSSPSPPPSPSASSSPSTSPSVSPSASSSSTTSPSPSST